MILDQIDLANNRINVLIGDAGLIGV